MSDMLADKPKLEPRIPLIEKQIEKTYGLLLHWRRGHKDPKTIPYLGLNQHIVTRELELPAADLLPLDATKEGNSSSRGRKERTDENAKSLSAKVPVSRSGVWSKFQPFLWSPYDRPIGVELNRHTIHYRSYSARYYQVGAELSPEFEISRQLRL